MQNEAPVVDAPKTNRIEGDDPRIVRVLEGDRQAAESLVAALLPRARNLVRFLVRGDADVEDYTHEGLLEVLRSLPTFRGESALTTWADRIVTRETLRRVKRARAQRRRREELASEWADVPQAAPRSDSGESYIERRQLVLWLDALPDDQRDALVLHHVVGLSVPEIADELGVPFDTAKSRLRLGMQKLRARWVEGT